MSADNALRTLIIIRFHGAGASLLQTRSQREQVKRKLEKISAVHTKIDELRVHAPETEEFRTLLGNVSQLLQEAEQVCTVSTVASPLSLMQNEIR